MLLPSVNLELCGYSRNPKTGITLLGNYYNRLDVGITKNGNYHSRLRCWVGTEIPVTVQAQTLFSKSVPTLQSAGVQTITFMTLRYHIGVILGVILG